MSVKHALNQFQVDFDVWALNTCPPWARDLRKGKIMEINMRYIYYAILLYFQQTNVPPTPLYLLAPVPDLQVFSLVLLSME